MKGHAIPIALARVVAGGLLAVAGLFKLKGAYAFAEALAAYRLLPAQLNHLLAVVLPWNELVTGLLLLFGLWVRAAALLSALLYAAFFLAVASAMARGLAVECGCFGFIGAARAGWTTLAIDLLGLGASIFIVIRTPPETRLDATPVQAVQPSTVQD